MRLGCALFLLTGCGFPDVRYSEAGTDGTVLDTGASEAGTDGASDAEMDVVTTGCKTNMDCDKTCTGKFPQMCGCIAFLADSAPPACDSTCNATGCLNKTSVCT